MLEPHKKLIKLCGVEILDNIKVLIPNGYRSTKKFIELVKQPPDLQKKKIEIVALLVVFVSLGNYIF